MNHTQILPEYIQGISVLKMSDSYGTPLYIYDAAIIASQVKYLKECFSFEKFRIHYAAKALSNSHILKLIHRLGCGVDAVSREEMEIALAAGIPPRDLNFSPSGAPISEYIFALDNRICCHVDNLGVLEVLAEQVSNLEVVLRCNPDIRAGGHAHLEIGAGDSKFGIYPEELPLIKKLIAKYGIKIIGIHAHVGSDIADENYFIRAFEYLLSLAEHFPDHLELLDFGGGFKVSYKNGDHPTDMARVARATTIRFNDFCKRINRSLSLVIEPGKYLVSDAGFFVAEVTALKHSGRSEIAYLNTGFNHLKRPMYYGAYHHIWNLSNPEGVLKQYKVVGYLCETDTFALGRSIPEIRLGDLLCFRNAGAYAMSMASNYNSRVRPAEVLIYEGKDFLIRRRETVTDITSTETDIDVI